MEPKRDILGNIIIVLFRGEYFFLSNFYVRPIVYEGITFHSSEQAFMWSKTLIPAEQTAILACPTPTKVKQFASDPVNVTLREGWEEYWRTVSMYRVLSCKYGQHPDLADQLMATDSANLIEGNWWHDNFWGDCLGRKDGAGNWLGCEKEKCKIPGNNYLGMMSMQIRFNLTTNTE